MRFGLDLEGGDDFSSCAVDGDGLDLEEVEVRKSP